MLFFLQNLAGQPIQYVLATLIGLLAAALVGMTVHEWAHNYVGHLMGDPNPKRLGKLTLNPMAHIFWPGFIMFVLIGFGILGTAPIAAHRMRNPRTGYLTAVAAGPVSNLVLAIVVAIISRIVNGIAGFNPSEFMIMIQLMLFYMIFFNLVLFVFNFLPFFPLDGWHIVLALLPAREAIWWERNAQMSQFVFFAAILIGFATPLDPLGLVVGQPVAWLMNLLLA